MLYHQCFQELAQLAATRPAVVHIHLHQGCTTYLMDTARNISGSEVGGHTEALGLCPQWGQEAKFLVRGSQNLHLPEADDVFAFTAVIMQKCSITKAVVCQNRQIFGGVQSAASQLSAAHIRVVHPDLHHVQKKVPLYFRY